MKHAADVLVTGTLQQAGRFRVDQLGYRIAELESGYGCLFELVRKRIDKVMRSGPVPVEQAELQAPGKLRKGLVIEAAYTIAHANTHTHTAPPPQALLKKKRISAPRYRHHTATRLIAYDVK